MNPVALWQAPHYYPYVCIRCGVGSGPSRTYFIDIGVTLSGYFNPMMEGSIYYCNECAANLISDINREVAKWHQDHSPWESPDRAEASYNWEKEIDLSGVDLEIERRGTPIGSNSEPVSDDSGSEQNDRVSEESTPVSEPSVPTVHAVESDRDFSFGV